MRNSLGSRGALPALSEDATDFLNTTFDTLDNVLGGLVAHHSQLNETSLDEELIRLIRESDFRHVTSTGLKVSIDAEVSDALENIRDEIVVDTHQISGGKHFDGGEIADLGFISVYKKHGIITRRKFCLIQSKRLFPRVIREQRQELDSGLRDRLMGFDKQSLYNELKIGNEQYNRISRFEDEWKTPVYYGFYNPDLLPLQMRGSSTNVVYLENAKKFGCRIMPSSAVRQVCSNLRTERPLRLGDLLTHAVTPFRGTRNRGGWGLSDFMVTKFLPCHSGTVYYDAGHTFDSAKLIDAMFDRRLPLFGVIRLEINYATPESLLTP